MKIILKLLILAFFSSISVAQAATVYVSRMGPTSEAASASAEVAWKAQYPGGNYWGIFRCGLASGASSPGPQIWECAAWGDYVAPLVVTVTARHMMPATACSNAIATWTAQYGATGTLTGTSIIEIYGNGANQRPTAFDCTASGTIPR